MRTRERSALALTLVAATIASAQLMVATRLDRETYERARDRAAASTSAIGALPGEHHDDAVRRARKAHLLAARCAGFAGDRAARRLHRWWADRLEQ